MFTDLRILQMPRLEAWLEFQNKYLAHFADTDRKLVDAAQVLSAD